MNISKYPAFELLQMQHKDILDDAFVRYCPDASEYTFTNLYSWRDAYKFYLSTLGECIILKSGTGDGAKFFDPIGRDDKKGVISTVLNDCRCEFIRMPESAKILFDGETSFIVEPDLNNSDYLYKVADLVGLAGGKYDGKRNLIKKFKASYAYEYLKLDESSIDETLAFEERWCSVKNCDIVEGLSNERRAIKEVLSNFSIFHMIGGAVKVSGNILAIALGERLNPNTLVMHVLKADPNMTGLYQTILHEFLLHVKGEFEYINLEQDLGVEGLRKAKQSYHPIGMVNKYTIRLR